MAVEFDLDPGVGPGDDGADGEGDDVPQAVKAAVLSAGVPESGEAAADGNGGLGHGSPPCGRRFRGESFGCSVVRDKAGPKNSVGSRGAIALHAPARPLE